MCFFSRRPAIFIRFSLTAIIAAAMLGPISAQTTIQKPTVAADGYAITPGVTAFLRQPDRYQLYLGPDIGAEYEQTQFRFDVAVMRHTDRSLVISYESYADGLLNGTLGADGTYTGTFRTNRSAGTFEMIFNEDGTATGRWTLDAASLKKFGLSVGNGDTGPNDLILKR